MTTIERADNTMCFLDAGGTAVPATLSATNCFTDLATRTPAAPLIPFDINSPLWSDGAEKERYFVLPAATSTVTVPAGGRIGTDPWEWPDGSLLIKTFLVQAFFIPSASMEDTLVEGDRVMVSRLVPGAFDVHRGDVVVFKDPGGWLPPPVPVCFPSSWNFSVPKRV